MVSHITIMKGTKNTVEVLILVVVDNGLVQGTEFAVSFPDSGLNPYCSGQWSRTILYFLITTLVVCLNPYCSGQWSRT